MDNPSPKVIDYADYRKPRLTPEDMAQLEAPLPVEDHEFLPKGKSRDGSKQQYLVYINQAGIIPLLNRVDPDWTWKIKSTLVQGASVIVTGTLTVKGVSKDGIGGNSDSTIDEDTFKAAETDALKRAALRFGVGLYLRGDLPSMWLSADLQPWEASKQCAEKFQTWYRQKFVNKVTGEISATPPPAQESKTPPERERVGGVANETPAVTDDRPETASKDETETFVKQITDYVGKDALRVDRMKEILAPFTYGGGGLRSIRPEQYTQAIDALKQALPPGQQLTLSEMSNIPF